MRLLARTSCQRVRAIVIKISNGPMKAVGPTEDIKHTATHKTDGVDPKDRFENLVGSQDPFDCLPSLRAFLQ